jgi:hypothetical protein
VSFDAPSAFCNAARKSRILTLIRMSFLKNTLKDDKNSQFLVDNIMCGHQSITYPQFLQIFGHDPLPNASAVLDKKRAATANRTRQSVTASDSYKNYMFAQIPNCTRFEPLKGSVSVHPMVPPRPCVCMLCFLFVSLSFPFCFLFVSFLFPFCFPFVSFLFPFCFLFVSLLFPFCFPWFSRVDFQALVTPAGMQSIRVGRTALARYNDGIYT